MIAPLLSLLLLLAPARAQDPADTASEQAVQDRLAQARLFARKGWYEDARAELDMALASATGDRSFDVHWLAAEVAWAMLDPLRAGEHAARAAELATDPRQQAAAQALADSYALGFGGVDLQPPHPGMVSRLQLEPASPQLDPELARYVDKLTLALRARTALPTRVGLPVGAYRINGQDVVVKAGQVETLPLPMRSLGARGLAALQVTRLELGVGVGVLAGAATDEIRPSPLAHLSLVQPVGPLLVGVMADGSLASWISRTGQANGPVATGLVGLRLGYEIPLGGPLAVRPAAVYRVGWQPGLPLACDAQGDSYVCQDASDPAAQQDRAALVYATGAAHRPGAELALDWREAGRTTALGLGVRVLVDHAIGQRPETGTARLSDGSEITWTTADTRWQATGLQLLAATSIAF
ncbi:MAG: hypothetical protein H6742_06315 [Alphaproteobacteria bacterium]|nr:hypothetical protein [Alphaproteobacteria bacterium]